MGSIPNWATTLGKENAEVPGSIPGAPEAWQCLGMCWAMVSAGPWLSTQRLAGHGRWIKNPFSDQGSNVVINHSAT